MIENLDIWKILGIATPVLLIIYWRNRNAVWGGLAIGAIMGLIVVLFSVFKGGGFSWYTVGKGAILGTMVGFAAELLGKVSDLIKRRQ